MSGRAERCQVLGKGVRRADPPAVFARRVAHAMGLAWRALPRRALLAHNLGSQLFEHGAKNRLFRGKERGELVQMAQAGARSSQRSSDFAQPKRRLVLLGSTSAVGQEAGGLWHRIAGVIGRSSRSHWYARGQLDERRVMA